jgi:hypothetical protein
VGGGILDTLHVYLYGTAGAADVVDREVFEQGTVWLHRGGKKAEKAEKCYN